MNEVIDELLDALNEDEGMESSNEQLAEYGAYINANQHRNGTAGVY